MNVNQLILVIIWKEAVNILHAKKSEGIYKYII